MKKCPLCKKDTILNTPMGEVCTNYDSFGGCGYVDGMDMGPRPKQRKKKSITEGQLLRNELKRANETIIRLQKTIWELEHADHCCGSCGNVIRPSHPADGC